MAKEMYIGTKIVSAEPQTKNGIDGFAVEYADGYKSWSPRDTFIEANISLGEVGHFPPFHIRLLGERAVLHSNITKLDDFLGSPEALSKLEFRDVELLKRRRVVMGELRDILDTRLQWLSESTNKS